MNKNSVSWFIIAIVILTKWCVTPLELPLLNLPSMLPLKVPPVVTKPIQYISQIPHKLVNLALYDVEKTKIEEGSLEKGYGSQLEEKNSENHMLKPPYENQSEQKYQEINNVSNHNINSNNADKKNSDQKYQSMGPDFDNFMQILVNLEKKFYKASFQKLLSISPPERQENGISFAQSGLFLYLQLMVLCTQSDAETEREIKQSLGLKTTCEEQIEILKKVMSSLPRTGEFVKFRWSSRLILDPWVNINYEMQNDTASVLHITVEYLKGNADAKEITKLLNNKVEIDSGGAMHNTFDVEELSNGICAVWITTLYLRARWQSSPTVLNGSRLFYDGYAPPRPVNMIRINDVMQYAFLAEWDAEAIDIRYADPELSLLIILPRERSLKKLALWMSSENLRGIYERMQTKRIAVTLPIYTLRMTLLLPQKLKAMGVTRLVNTNGVSDCESLKISHAVQRIMFWAEAGRNAFKDDGLEWDEAPEFERIMDHPYLFYVRWRNLTLLHGHFVL